MYMGDSSFLQLVYYRSIITMAFLRKPKFRLPLAQTYVVAAVRPQFYVSNQSIWRKILLTGRVKFLKVPDPMGWSNGRRVDRWDGIRPLRPRIV